MGTKKRFADYVSPTKISYLNGKPTTIHVRKCRILSHDTEQPQTWVFEHGHVTIGSMEGNDVTITDDTVSRQHAEIVQENEAFLLRDLSSTNGTFINHVHIKEAYLSPGALMRFGEREFIFQPMDEEVAIVPSNEQKFGDIIGGNVKMREIYGILEKIAPTNATVVIEGETGTGKEVIAHTIHKMSLRAKKPFVVFDCGAVPESLIESELFGHEKGSFTGAIMTRQGLFELAQGGTIFLDELGELSLELQPKLLRVLEQREVRRVGAAKAIPVDVRVVAATNRKLEEEVRNNRFREDLFYRLSVVRIFIPPLRDRIDDLSLLVKHFLKHSAFNRDRNGKLKLRSISRQALDAMIHYHWPGNVRELLNIVERSCSLADTDCIDINDLPNHIAKQSIYAHNTNQQSVEQSTATNTAPASTTPPNENSEPDHLMITSTENGPKIDEAFCDKPFKDAKEEWMSTFETDYIATLLKRNDHNISQAAREADIDRKYFRKLMKKYDISASDD